MMRIAVIVLALAMGSARAFADDVAGFDDHDGAQLPDSKFVDENTKPVHMSQFFDRPFYLAFAYHTCPQLCGLVLGQFASTLRDVPGRVGDAFDVVVVSIDPSDTAERSREAQQRTVARYGGNVDGWHFLTGDEQSIREITHAAGFRYLLDPMRGTFVHPAGVLYIERGGIVRGHVEGTGFTAASLIAARAAKSSSWDRLCGALGVGNSAHSASVAAALRISAVGMLVAFGGFVVWRIRKSGTAR